LIVSYSVVGGGFPGRLSSGITFEEVADALGPLLDKLFPPDVSIISEPGRFFCSAAYTLAVQVYARRTVFREKEKTIVSQVPSPPKDDDSDSEQTISSDSTLDGTQQKASYMYYVNDGVYGSFNCILFDHATVKPKILRKNGEYFPNAKEMPMFPCSIWGPTCDSMDCIGKEFLLPELNVGDWLVFEDMGAYTKAAASEFNGFRRSKVIYLE
jgi:ornithine decarboxylase